MFDLTKPEAVRLGVAAIAIFIDLGAALHLEANQAGGALLPFALLLAVAIAVIAIMDLRSRRRDRIDSATRQAALTVELELKAANKALTLALASVPHGVILVERDWRIAMVNDAARDILQLPPELAKPGVDGRELMRFQIALGEFSGDDALMQEILSRPDISAMQLQGQKYERKTHDGRTLEIRSTFLEDGRQIRTYTDVSERVAAIDALNSAVRARSEFLNTVSHELRTPLNAIIGLSGLLQSQNLTHEEQRDLRLIEDAGQQLRSLVDDIMAASSQETGNLTLQEKPFDLPAALHKISETIRRRAEVKGLSLTVRIAPDTPHMVLGDEDKLCSMVWRLLDNAVKFTPSGHVTLSAGSVRQDADFHHISLSVSDTGIGIATENHETLFAPFSQVDSSSTRRFNGMGIGLKLFKDILTAMGGSVLVRSELGKGTEFRLELPLRRVPSTTSLPAAVDADKSKLRVLVAEDVDTNRNVLLQVLQRLGYRTHGVADGAAAVAEISANPYDLVVMDIMMPTMDGIEATRAIRALPGTISQIPVLALTSRVLGEVQDQCFEAGVDRVEKRPINTLRLKEALESVLTDYGSRMSAKGT